MACEQCGEKLEQLEHRADDLAGDVAAVRAEVLACGKLTRSTGYLTIAIALAVLYLAWDLDKPAKAKAAAA
jgi:hypothetical protein